MTWRKVTGEHGKRPDDWVAQGLAMFQRIAGKSLLMNLTPARWILGDQTYIYRKPAASCAPCKST